MGVLNVKLNFSFLCDYASVSREGKLSMSGIFENINARTFPVYHPLMYVVANLSGVTSEDNFTCELTPALGQQAKLAVITSKANIDAQKNFGFIGQFVNVRYETPGDYLLKFYIDNKEVGTHKFQVRIMP